MPANYVALILTVLCGIVTAQSQSISPLGQFSAPLENHGGRGASVAFFHARGSRLYFVQTNPNGSFAIQTDPNGTVQSAGSLGEGQITAFDVDDSGNSYVVSDGSRLTEFDPTWGVRKTLVLPSPISAFAVVGGKPMGVGADRILGYLDPPARNSTLEVYGPPWLLFATGPDRLGILRPEVAMVHVFQVDGLWSDHNLMDSAIRDRKPFAAAATPDGRIFLLSSSRAPGTASVVVCDDHGHPQGDFEYALPVAVNPTMIGATADRLYLVDAAGRVVFYPKRNQKPTREFDSIPKLLSDLAPLRKAAREVGYLEEISVLLNVGEDGVPRNIRIEKPTALANAPGVMDAIRAWRFQPAVKSGKPSSG